MGLPLVPILSGIGTIFKVFGALKRNRDEANAEKRNAAFYEEQAQYTEYAGREKKRLLEYENANVLNKQRSAFAKSGISFTGSALDFQFGTQNMQMKEIEALEKQTSYETRLARTRAQSSLKHAKDLTNPLTQILESGGTILGDAATWIKGKD